MKVGQLIEALNRFDHNMEVRARSSSGTFWRDSTTVRISNRVTEGGAVCIEGSGEDTETDNEEVVVISKKLLKEYKGCVNMLAALEVVGVDNWEGYDDAMVMLEESEYYKEVYNVEDEL